MKQPTKEQFQTLAEEAIELLSDEQRIALRENMLANGFTVLPRNLFFNYETQKWIETEKGEVF
jgi:hypothetical protein